MQTIETERAQPNGRNNNIIHQQEEAVLNSNQTIGTVESIFQNKYTEPIQKDTTLQLDTRNLLHCSELNTLDWELKQRPKVARYPRCWLLAGHPSSTLNAGPNPIYPPQPFIGRCSCCGRYCSQNVDK